MISKLFGMAPRINESIAKHKRWVPVGSFLLGFAFDATVLTRIDEPKVMIQQAFYLLISACLIGIELAEEVQPVKPYKVFTLPWKYRESILHFLLGTLLNSYAIFYFKSASELTTFLFIGLLVVLLTLNEFKEFGKSETQVHIGLLSLCLISYLVSLAPTMLGFMGTIPFLCAVGLSSLFFYGFYLAMKKVIVKPRHLKTHLLYPYVGVQLVFVFLYFMHMIPPVPLSIKFMGIYHNFEKTDQGYKLSYTRSEWIFWQNGDQTFLARPGDAIYCYAQIFSPTRFKDQLQVRWLFWENDKKEWVSSDKIPLPVQGGREEGYRAVTRKENFHPGAWRVQIELLNNQVVGRIDFKVVQDQVNYEREVKTVLK